MRIPPLTALTTALALTACSGGSAVDATGGQLAPTEDAGVVVQGFRFQPQTIEVPVGATVVWRNEDQINHTATAGTPDEADAAFDVELSEAGTSGGHAFDEPGRYRYFCRFHGSMTGEVLVTY